MPNEIGETMHDLCPCLLQTFEEIAYNQSKEMNWDGATKTGKWVVEHTSQFRVRCHIFHRQGIIHGANYVRACI